MSNVFVVNNTTSSEVIAVTVAKDKAPKIAFSNQANNATTVTASHEQASVDAVYDGLTTVKWRPANTTSSIQFDGSFTDVDYIGVAGVNWNTTTTVLTVKDNAGATLATVSGLEDNQPALMVITGAAQTTVKFEFSSATTGLEVGELYFGTAVSLPRNVTVGYQPGRWTNNDIKTLGKTESNQFGPSVTRSRGTTESFQINFVQTAWMDSTWKTFIREANGIPVFFLWNKDNADNAIYGNWEAPPPSYTSSLFSSIRMTIRGVA